MKEILKPRQEGTMLCYVAVCSICKNEKTKKSKNKNL